MRARATAGGCAARNAVGDMPNVRPKLVVKDPTLDSPTVKQMSATERSVVRSSPAARSRRRVSRYWCGVSPKAVLNDRLKWASETCALRARAGTSSGPA